MAAHETFHFFLRCTPTIRCLKSLDFVLDSKLYSAFTHTKNTVKETNQTNLLGSTNHNSNFLVIFAGVNIKTHFKKS